MERKDIGNISAECCFLAKKVIEWLLKGECTEQKGSPCTEPMSVSADLHSSSCCPAKLFQAELRLPGSSPWAGLAVLLPAWHSSTTASRGEQTALVLVLLQLSTRLQQVMGLRCIIPKQV